MVFACDSCNKTFSTTRGLAQHQRGCDIFLAADESENALPGNAFEKYQAKNHAKKRKLAHHVEVEELVEESDSAGPSYSQHEQFASGEGAMDVDAPLLASNESPALLSPPASPPLPPAEGRGQRTRRPTWKILQQRPVGPSPLPTVSMPSAEDSDSDDEPLPSSIIETVWHTIRTACNPFGLYREYPSRPTHNPDDHLGLDAFSDAATVPTVPVDPILPSTNVPAVVPHENPYHPFKNSTVHGLMDWLWNGSIMKSVSEATKLVNFLKSDDFKKEDLDGFDVRAETAKFDKHLEGGADKPTGDGWKESEVEIDVPDGMPHPPGEVPKFTVPGLFHRSLIQVSKAAIQDVSSRLWHYTPFKSFWKKSDSDPPQRIFDELYSSDAMLEAHSKLQRQPAEPGCTLERVVLSFMIWSDSTHLASFGSASLWPIYLFFGNQSKWTRGKPSTGSCHHIAYIPKLPDSFHDFFVQLTGTGPSADVLTHCRRELMHAIWTCLLDAEFLEAYEHGIVIECPDGIFRRFYPRIFTYSADYPEKVLLATIRNLGGYPCPTCLVPKEKIPELGQKLDDRRRGTNARVDTEQRRSRVKFARDFIYEKGKGVKSAAVERLLAETSAVPTNNAFSSLSRFGFNFFSMLVPDFMHEFELGVWKATFTHLIRIVVAHGDGAVQALNTRYRQVPTFGRSTIRSFTENASSMKKLAARNYEDLLQCAMPVFDGLLPDEHNDTVLSLLFTLAEWHCLGKLRLHTETSVGWLEQCTTNLGKQLRHFQSYTCGFFDTRELPKEEAARGRRQKKARAARTRAPGRSQVPPQPQTSTTGTTGPKRKAFNLIMYKLHALGDYVRSIRLFGTSDSYSTQPGELEHRRVKKFYARTNKNRAVRQMTRQERREYALRKQKRRLAKKAEDHAQKSSSKRRKSHQTTQAATRRPTVSFTESEPLPFTPPEVHHHISTSRNFPAHIHTFLDSTREDDPAIENFYPKLQEHLMGRLRHPEWSGDGEEFTPEERAKLYIMDERMYMHKVMRVNYTGYDMRQGQDSINSRNHANIMTLSREDADHPFEYGRVIGIFHVDVGINEGPSRASVSKEVLWVRWYRRDSTYRAGFKRKRLHRLAFLPEDDPKAFGFLDPDEVIRAAHLIPAFRHGATEERGESLGRAEGEGDDWQYFYVNIFVDRDMYMRYAGDGVGHYRVDTADVQPAQPIQEPDENGPPIEEVEETSSITEPEAEEDLRAAAAASEDAENNQDGDDSDSDEFDAEGDVDNGGRDSDEEDEQGEGEGEEGEEPEAFGAEDGEGGFEDREDEEGYAPL